MTGLHYMALFERMKAGFLPPTGENGLDREARGPLEQRAVELIHQAQIARGSSSFAGNRRKDLP